MTYRRMGIRLMIGTVVALIVMNLIDFYPYFRIFIGAFGIGGGLVLLMIGNAMHRDD